MPESSDLSLTHCGVDIGGSSLRVGAVTPTGVILRSLREPHGDDLSPSAVLAHLHRLVRQLYAGTSSPRGVGAGVAAWVARETGTVVSAPNLPWSDVPLRDELSRLFPGMPVLVTNDLKAIAWGEYRFGAGRDARGQSLLVVFAGTGIGSASIDQGQLVLGAGGFAGEIGHVRTEDSPAARVCGCGARGCLEAYASGRALAERSGGRPAAALEAEALRGDATAHGLLVEAGTRLGRALATAVMLADPAVLVLGGGVWEASEIYRRAALDGLRDAVHPTRWNGLIVRDANLGNEAGIAGAADLCRACATT